MNETFHQLGALFTYRRRALANFLGSLTAGRRAVAGATLVVFGGVVLAAGEWAAPSLLAPPTEVAAGGLRGSARTLPPGTTALEAAFWSTVLLVAVLNFRVVELLFRREDVRVLDSFPVDSRSLLGDRTAAAAVEAFVAVAGMSLFFAPLVWHGAPKVALLACGIAAGGVAAGVCTGFAVQLYTGRTGLDSSDRGRSADMYGGPGQLFLLSPALSFAAAALLTLVARLLAGELLYPDPPIDAVGWGTALFALVCSGLFVLGARIFDADYRRIAAQFREADLTSFRPTAFDSGERLARPALGERWLPEGARIVYRAGVRQYGRRFVLARYGYVAGWIGAVAALTQWSRTAFPTWAVVGVPAVAAVVLYNPWIRIASPPITPDVGRFLPIDEHDRRAAHEMLAAREIAIATSPYSIAVLVADGGRLGWGGAGLEAAAGLAGVLSLNVLVGAARAGGLDGWRADVAVPAAGTAAVAASAALDMRLAAGVWGGVWIVGVLLRGVRR
ncbi:MAG: hypothetical protein ABEL76_13740 [Bradymonadaceae bacterium]